MSNMEQLMEMATSRRNKLNSLCSLCGDHSIDERLWQATPDEVSQIDDCRTSGLNDLYAAEWSGPP